MSTEATTPVKPLGLPDYAAISVGVLVLVSALAAMAFAAIHHAQIDDARAYRESFLILPELGTLLCSCGNQPFVLVGFITLLVRRRFKLALAVGLAGFLGLVAAYAAVALDSSTLLYAT
ncbi:MAG: hypothetical protein R3B40_05860 [Polyangiales bacterium]|nr:hypothetical protein [Myxococcales bacterium]MCB9657462.1 hypothetical protein [Sandaracinaceae bacterium]